MNILILNYEYPPVGGGAGEVAHSLAREYAARGNKVSVISSSCAGAADREERDGVMVYRVPSYRRELGRGTFFQMFCYVVNALDFIRRNRDKLPADVVHCHFLVPTGYLAERFYRMYKVPYIVTLHGGDVPSFVPEQTGPAFRLIKPIADRAGKMAHRVVAVSESLADLARNDYPCFSEKIVAIPNGIETMDHDVVADKTQSVVQFVFAGRLTPQKNLLFLLEVLSGVDRDFKLVVLGEGPQESQARQFVREHKLTDRVVFRGWVGRDEVLDTMRHSHFLLMPSLKEGMPVAGLQAYACGLPIIGMRSPGVEQFVEDGISGYILDNDVASWRDLFVRLCHEPEISQSMAEACRDLARRKYSWNAIGSQYLKLFKDIGR